MDVFNSSFHTVSLAAGAFTDPSLPTALQDAKKHDDVAGAGNGFVDVYNTAGAFEGRLISHGALDSPWGLAVAPASFGPFGGDLLVGNFGSGEIDAYNPLNGTFLGVLTDSKGNPIINEGLWGLSFGNGSNGFNANDLYFTAGIPGPGAVEDHGLFGVIQPTPKPGIFVGSDFA